MWQVRQARATDIPDIERLLIAADGDREELRKEQFVVAAEDDGTILGCGRLRPYLAFCELASLAVTKEAQAGGVGGELVATLVKMFLGPIYLICEDGVVDFFRRFDFGLIPDSDMPAGLRPKWEYFVGHAGPMNVMLRE